VCVVCVMFLLKATCLRITSFAGVHERVCVWYVCVCVCVRMCKHVSMCVCA